jgi:hypothetical protein
MAALMAPPELNVSPPAVRFTAPVLLKTQPLKLGVAEPVLLKVPLLTKVLIALFWLNTLLALGLALEMDLPQHSTLVIFHMKTCNYLD